MHQQSQDHINNGNPSADLHENQVKKLVQLNQDKVEYPPANYTVTEVYMIRKQSIAHSNELIVKRLSRCFQKIKKIKAAGREKELYREYDQEVSNIRRSFRKVHDLFKLGSKATEITQKKIDKMKNRIDKVKKQVSKDEFFLAKDLDVSKVYLRAQHPQPSSSQKTIQK